MENTGKHSFLPSVCNWRARREKRKWDKKQYLKKIIDNNFRNWWKASIPSCRKFYISIVAQLVKEPTCSEGPGFDSRMGDPCRKCSTPVSWPGDSMDCVVHRVTRSHTRLSNVHFTSLHIPNRVSKSHAKEAHYG